MCLTNKELINNYRFLFTIIIKNLVWLKKSTILKEYALYKQKIKKKGRYLV